MSDGDLNARPESHDEGWKREERRYDKGGISAGKWLNLLVLALVLVAVGYIAYGAAAAYFPRRWAEEVGARVGGSRTQAVAYGFGVGALFTFVPLVVFAQIRRGFFNWTWRLIVALVAIVLALPNWLTLAVAIGTSDASAAGRTIMTAQAPGFRNGSAAGAIAGLIVGLLVVGTGMRLGHQRKKVKELRGRVGELERAHAPAGHGDADATPTKRGLFRRRPKPHKHEKAADGASPRPVELDGSEHERLAQPTDHTPTSD